MFISVYLWLHFVQFMQTKNLASLRRIFGIVVRITAPIRRWTGSTGGRPPPRHPQRQLRRLMRLERPARATGKKIVVIVGGGFAGLNAAKQLANAPGVDRARSVAGMAVCPRVLLDRL